MNNKPDGKSNKKAITTSTDTSPFRRQSVGKRDPQLEADVREWIEAVTGEKWPAGDYAKILK